MRVAFLVSDFAGGPTGYEDGLTRCGANLRRAGSGGGGNDALECGGHLVGLESVGARLALVSDATVGANHVEPVGPACVRGLGRVLQVVNDGGNLEAQLGHAGVGHGATFVQALLAGDGDFFFDVVLILPRVDGMGFLDIDDVEGRLILVLLVELVERGNLPAERWSGVASEDEHYRLVTAKGGELDARLFVVGRKLEAWRRVTHLEPSRAGNKPELLERNHEERRAGDVPHDSAEKRGLSHHREQTREHTNVEHQD